jgi:hypothetical protein
VVNQICILSESKVPANNKRSMKVWILSSLCYGEEPCSMRVGVPPYQVNIDSDGAEHFVRVPDAHDMRLSPIK